MRPSKAVPLVIVIILVLAISITGLLYKSGALDSLKSNSQHPSESLTPQLSAKDQLACTAALPVSVKIGQKIMAAGYGNQLDSEASVFNSASIGGTIIMDQATAVQIRTFQNGQIVSPFIATDQEGGTVQRYTSEGSLPSATDMAGNVSAAQAYDLYLKDDQYLKSIGITTNFAPIVDVISLTPSPLPGRMFAYNPAVVVTYASKAIQASQKVGITPVIKHFPGLGSATGNTDYGSATTDPLATLKTRDLIPYTKLAQFHPDVMVSNAIVPGLTDGQPASWSAPAVSLLRSLGYQQSVIYSDSLTARAIPGSLSAAVIKAWQAGIDVALIVQTKDQTVDLAAYFSAITASAKAALQSGEISSSDMNASVQRIFVRKGINACDIRMSPSVLHI